MLQAAGPGLLSADSHLYSTLQRGQVRMSLRAPTGEEVGSPASGGGGQSGRDHPIPEAAKPLPWGGVAGL